MEHPTIILDSGEPVTIMHLRGGVVSVWTPTSATRVTAGDCVALADALYAEAERRAQQECEDHNAVLGLSR